MPTYDFACIECGHEEERLVKYEDKNKQMCTKCDSLEPMATVIKDSANLPYMNRLGQSYKPRREFER